MEKPRVLYNVLVKTFNDTVGENFIGFQPTCRYTAHCHVIASCGTASGGFLSDCGIDSPGADLSCKIKICKQTYFLYYLSRVPRVLTSVRSYVALPTGHDFPVTG